VWEKLEEQNPEFFKAYYIRLKVGGTSWATRDHVGHAHVITICIHLG
jgi:hypothetical protein